MSEAPHEYASGAKRSEKLPLMRLIPHSTLRHLALALTEGNRKYEMIDGRHCPTTCNWRNGDLQFQLDCADHLMNHVATFCTQLHKFGLAPNFIQTAKHEMLLELGHALANIAFLIEFIEKDRAGLLELIQFEAEIVDGIKRAKQARKESREEAGDSWKAVEGGAYWPATAVKYPRYFQRHEKDLLLWCHTGVDCRAWVDAATGKLDSRVSLGDPLISIVDSDYSKEVFPTWAAK